MRSLMTDNDAEGYITLLQNVLATNFISFGQDINLGPSFPNYSLPLDYSKIRIVRMGRTNRIFRVWAYSVSQPGNQKSVDSQQAVPDLSPPPLGNFPVNLSY